jgi:hypothetical protein
MQSVWTFTRNLNLIGATQTLPSSLNVLLFSNAFGLRSVRSSISSRHHAQVVLWIYVLGTCIHHCNIPAVFIFFFYYFFWHTICMGIILSIFQIWNADLGASSLYFLLLLLLPETNRMNVKMMAYMENRGRSNKSYK